MRFSLNKARLHFSGAEIATFATRGIIVAGVRSLCFPCVAMNTLPIITPPRRANRKHRAARRLIRAAVIAAAIPAAAWLVAYGVTTAILTLRH